MLKLVRVSCIGFKEIWTACRLRSAYQCACHSGARDPDQYGDLLHHHGKHARRSGTDYDPESRLRASGCQHLLILVHGFNNSASAAKNSYMLQLAALEEHFRQSRSAPDAIAFFYLPGDVGGYASLGGYPYDIPQARESAERLAQYLKTFPNASNPGALKISLIAHPLGCRLILEMLANALPTALTLNIEVVSLMAPAVPVELVTASGALQVTVRDPRRVLKCFSHQDWVLWAAFPLGQMAAYELNKETQYYSEAVGLYGHPAGMGKAIATSNGHSDYWGDRNVANQFSTAIDPTFYALPPPRNAPARALAEIVGLGRRMLPSRD
jgi:hypothetical protein